MRAGRGGTALRPALGPALGPAVALVLVLVGCAQPPELDADRAGALQSAVLTVSEEAAAGRYDAAQAALAQVREQLEAAADAGEVSTARYRQVDDALDRTGQEVAAALEAQAAAARAAAEQAAAEQAAAEQAAAEQAAAERAAAEQAAAARDAAAPAGKGDGPKDMKGPKGKGKEGDDD
ncbi:mucin-associated surface protein [Cellulomonas cellasea]|uniref:Cobalamin biosynthesis Mg chelatase CobN n=1 Tax=Cellulomonas cellasea TaxID=43670 RepID=A0A7W4UCI8_9CELL|nr:mucin-associated surface protein [Cellulomonas cellasea]MBB2921688.1 cobalamin biosynthesis Mg chelatase CobN [Cellulomonas cellasea]